MLEDANDSHWRSRELQNGLEALFPKSLDTVQGIIEEIRSTLETLQNELACFDEIARMSTRKEALKDTIRRVREKVKITWDKTRFENEIRNLRELNDDLRCLREQAAEIKEPVLRNASCSRPAQQLSQEYGSISKVRRASKAFHQALATAWLKELSEARVEEMRHDVKLKLHTRVEDNVQMEVMIVCYGHAWPPPTPIRAGFMRLHVESRPLDFMESGLNTPPHSGDDDRRKKRKVHFDFSDTQEMSKISTPVVKRQHPSIVDLRLAGDICTALQVRDSDPCNSNCLGYLDSCSNETFRHSFFGMSTKKSMTESTCVSGEEILTQPAETSVTFVDQLRLAHSFAVAVLKFHSTPWLRKYVSLHELSFFRFDDGDLSSCIRTAHLGSDFIQASSSEHFSMPTEDLTDNRAIEDAKLLHGVRNVTLWGLGTVMLQIGTWSMIKSPDDVVAVRRLAQRTPMLGKRYRDLTKQCLECDFAFGDDLSRPRLQQAVYEHVVCGLAEMINSLDIDEE
ncbi:hypothetical protein J7T55_015217 [Diaporthe amygdali]|uniref:uncharacterized protein n=1 Tax=Phomopsis amygdali TaxID=1214568 RepID=UPI0022FE573C|nr:uncharacterized protein J7T55_015217 [Diaporthe amygdali]KAJ0120488.1 hypothetical protein J7T55_015217 [Diaporthe amygdali]